MLAIERQRIGDTCIRQVVANIVARVRIGDQLTVLDALLHFRIDRYRPDRLRARRNDQRRASDHGHFIHELGIGPVGEPAHHPAEVILADLIHEPVHQFLIHVANGKAVVDGFAEHRAHPAHGRVGHPALALLALESGGRTIQDQAVHARGIVDCELLCGVSARRVAEQMHPVQPEMIQRFHHVQREPRLVERYVLRRNLRRAVPAGIEAYHAKVARESRHHRIETPRASHRRVEHHQDGRILPRVGEVVEVIDEAHAVASIETALSGHDSDSSRSGSYACTW